MNVTKRATKATMSIVALDLSLTATGWAHSDGRSGVWVPSKHVGLGLARMRWIRDTILATVAGAQLVAIEGYAFGAQGNAMFNLAELGGVVRMALFDSGVPFADVPPSSLKLFATGKGNAPKDQVLAAAIRQLGYAGHDHNAADALWLLSMALVRNADPATLTEPQRRALAKIAWPS